MGLSQFNETAEHSNDHIQHELTETSGTKISVESATYREYPIRVGKLLYEITRSR